MELTQFCWYVKAEDFDELGNLDLSIKAGRLRHRWVPKSKSAAVRYLTQSPEAEGLRAAADDYLIVNIILAEPIKDLSADYPNAVIPGAHGAVIRVPFEHTLQVAPKDWQIEEGMEPPAISYRLGNKSIVNTYKPKQFGSLEMGLLTPSEIRNMSKVDVISAGAFQDNNPENEQTPVRNGVHDLRMGTIDKDSRCETCNLNHDEQDSTFSCQGHFGRIELAIPVPKLQFLGTLKSLAKKTDPLLNALNRVCYHCSRLMLPQGTIDSLRPSVMSVFENNKRNFGGYQTIRSQVLDSFSSYHGTKPEDRQPCPHCSEFSPEVKFNHTNAAFTFNVPDKRYFDGATGFASFIIPHEVLAGVIEDDVYFLGMDPTKAHPKDMFFEVLPVAPNTARPQRVLPGKKLKELDDLTKLYQDVVAANDRMDDFIIRGVGNERVWTKKLYHAVSRVYNNQTTAIGSGGTSQERGYGGAERAVSFKGVLNRLTGKRGRFRNNLQSKYAQEVSYSIITPHAALAIDEVGVPKKVAMEASMLETVTADNIDRLKQMAANGSKKYPGMNYVFVDGNVRGSPRKVPAQGMTEIQVDSNIVEGAKVKRHILNGDIGLFNRAPSLHRQSVLAMRCKILESKSLAMNPTVCIPFNADYDGDAMKLHFVQSEEAIDEAKRLMQLDKNIIHARYGKLTVATDQDQTSGLYLLSHTDKRRKGEWNKRTGLGFTEEGIPYISKSLAISAFTYVFSEIRNEKELKDRYKHYKRNSIEKALPYKLWRLSPQYRTVDSLPEPDVIDGDGNPAYSGRAIFSHLFTVLDCEYVSATFIGNSPAVDDEGNIQRKDGDALILDKNQNHRKKIKERIIVYKGKLIKGTLEKDSFGEGGSSLAPAFIYHEGYEAGQAKLVEYIEMVTRLGYAAHRVIGYTMGVGDVGLFGQTEVKQELSALYDRYATEITKWNKAYREKTHMSLVENEDERIEATLDPANFIEEKIINLASEYEERMLGPIEDTQGSGNPMQIAVRSKARGKDQNVRQMGGSFGIVLVGGRRIVHGINAYRALPHFPLTQENGVQYDIDHPVHTGFVKSGYATGMGPMEFWQTSTAGRRSAVESGQGNISKSGYLERKMIKALEPMVVNDKKQVVNIRTGRVINPLVGDDGLAPYHIRGTDDSLNSSGHILTLQPLLFEFDCKHGKPLEDVHAGEYFIHACSECKKPAKTDIIVEELKSLKGFTPSLKTKMTLFDKIKDREIPVPTLRKIARRLHAFHNDSICRTGEAIGATAGGCLGEPATQAALRTFHFAGKMSFQGSVDRLEQMLESPLTANTNIKNPQTTVELAPAANKKSMADKLAAVCRSVIMENVVDLIKMDPLNMTLAVVFNARKLSSLRLGTTQAIVLSQIQKAFNATKINYEFAGNNLDFGRPFMIRVLSSDHSDLMIAKESILSAKISGITDALLVKVVEKEGQYSLDIRDASNESLKSIVERLGEHLNLQSLKTNNLGWIYRNFGLEAFQYQFIQELDFQMNGPGGVGEYDVRYIRMIADVIGEEGIPLSLGPKASTGLGSGGNYSVLSAASTEGAPKAIMGGAIMGNLDNLEGPAEAIVTGSVPSIGDYAPTF
jgi:DNA-directed RNA polymerase subunit A'